MTSPTDLTVREKTLAANAEGVGYKDDAAKTRWGLLPWGAVKEIADVFTYGASKYAPDNWKKVVDRRSRYFDALHRHLYAWQKGEKNDPDSGHNHLAHAGCCLLMLLWMDLTGDAGL